MHLGRGTVAVWRLAANRTGMLLVHRLYEVQRRSRIGSAFELGWCRKMPWRRTTAMSWLVAVRAPWVVGCRRDRGSGRLPFKARRSIRVRSLLFASSWKSLVGFWRRKCTLSRWPHMIHIQATGEDQFVGHIRRAECPDLVECFERTFLSYLCGQPFQLTPVRRYLYGLHECGISNACDDHNMVSRRTGKAGEIRIVAPHDALSRGVGPVGSKAIPAALINDGVLTVRQRKARNVGKRLFQISEISQQSQIHEIVAA